MKHYGRTARELLNLQRGRSTSWYRIVNQGSLAVVHLYDSIGLFGTTSAEFVNQINEINTPIELHINSEGGEIFDGLAIYHALQQRGDVKTFVDGLAASIASVIAMAGTEVNMSKHSQLMLHDAFTVAGGNASELRDLADLLDRQSNNIAGIYADKTGDSSEHWREIMRNEAWYSAEEAVDAGLADRIVPVLKNAASEPYVGRTQARHEPMTGRHAHDHSAHGAEDHDDGMHYHVHEHHGDALHDHEHTEGMGGEGGNPQISVDGIERAILNVLNEQIENAKKKSSSTGENDGGNSHGVHSGDHTHVHDAHDGPDMNGDGSHSHEHTHSGDAEHDHSHSGVSGRDSADDLSIGDAIALILNSGVDMLNWDAASALAKCHSAGDFRSVCAGERSAGEPDSREHWALPHHSGPGSGPDKGGVVAALGRWSQTEGLKNKDAALSHLKAHARSLGLPSGDSDDSKSSDHFDMDKWFDENVDQVLAALKGA